METKIKNAKTVLIISGLTIIISIVGFTFALLNLRLLMINGEDTVVALALFWSMLVFLFSNITLFTIHLNKYRKTPF